MSAADLVAQALEGLTRDSIEKYFSGPGAHWANDRYFTVDPLRPTAGTVFTISTGGRYCRGVGGKGNEGDVVELLAQRDGVPLEVAAARLLGQDFANGATMADSILEPVERLARARIGEAVALGADLTDVGNGQALAVLIRGLALFVRGQGWMVYDPRAGRWGGDLRGDLVRRLAALLVEVRKAGLTTAGERAAWTWARWTGSRRGIQSAVEMAAVSPGVLEELEAFDRDPDAALTRDGTRVDLRTGATRPATPGDRFSKALGASFVADARAPRWESFLAQVLPDNEVRRFLQVWTGYALTGRVSESVLLVLYGSGANGKSVFVNTVLRLFGSYGRALPPEVLLPADGKGPEPSALAELLGLRLAVFSETNEGGRLNESALKRATSEDPIAARRLYQAPMTFLPTHAAALVTNHLPRVRSTDAGTWRRLAVVRWPVTIPEVERDQALPDTLASELPGILAWALEGSRVWYAERLHRPRSVLVETEDFKADQDIFGGFLEGQAQGDSFTAPASKLFDVYRQWADSEGVKAVGQAAFKRELKARGFDQVKKAQGLFFVGIGLDPPIVQSSLHAPQTFPITRVLKEVRESAGLPCTGSEGEQPPTVPELSEPFKLASSSGFGVF